MNIGNLKDNIIQGKFDSIYLFTGDEWKVQEIYTKQIAEKSKHKLVHKDSVYDILSELKSGGSLFASNSCFVLRDDKELLDSVKLNKIKSMLGNNILILIYTKLDKRTTFYKQFKDNIIEFERLNENILIKYLSKEIDLSIDNLRLLIELCESDYGRCLLEINKIKNYDIDNSNAAFMLLVDKGLIYYPPKDAVFELVDAVLTAKGKRAYDLLQHCKEIGEANLVILSVLSTNCRQVLQVQSYVGNDILNATGLTQWQVNKAREKSGYYDNRQLINIMKLIQKVEEGIKTGRIEDSISVEYILEEIFGGNL